MKAMSLGDKDVRAYISSLSISLNYLARRSRRAEELTGWLVCAPQNMFGGRNPLVPFGCLATGIVLCRVRAPALLRVSSQRKPKLILFFWPRICCLFFLTQTEPVLKTGDFRNVYG